MPDFPARPNFRLTVRRGSVLAVDFGPDLATGGPFVAILRAGGRPRCAIADVTVLHNGDELATEAVVAFLIGETPAARAAVTSWAADVGYRRLWFAEDVVELPGPHFGEARTRCRGCGVRLTDGAPAFWHHVRATGRFPTLCVLCGSDLPQWRLCQASGSRDDQHSMPVPLHRRSPCT